MTRLAALTFVVSVWCTSLGTLAAGADLTGAWTTNQAYCGKVFAKSGAKVSFTKDAELEGGGFIVEGKEIRGTNARCQIKAAKEDGTTTHMIAACATDIMLSDTQLSFRTIDANTITRLFPGMPDLETNYYRCPM